MPDNSTAKTQEFIVIAYTNKKVHFNEVMDYVSTKIVTRVLDVAFKENVVTPGSALGITGRAGITGRKPQLILEAVQDKFDKVVFVEDGLALGSAIMARCMNSMGTQKSPIGGCQGQKCILGKRMKLQGSKYA